MTVLLVVAAFVTVVGALVAVTARDARTALAGLVASLIAVPLVADPPPGIAALGVRAVAALLGGYLLLVVVGRASRVSRGSLVGLPAEALAAAAAFVIGFGSDGLASTPVGPPLALGAGLALIALAVAPVARAGDALRLGVALTVLISGAELLRVGLAGTPAPLEQLLTAALTLALLVTTAVLGWAALATTEGFTLREEARTSGIFEAHPVASASAGERARRTWRVRRPTRIGLPSREPDAHRASPAETAADEPSPRAEGTAEPDDVLWRRTMMRRATWPHEITPEPNVSGDAGDDPPALDAPATHDAGADAAQADETVPPEADDGPAAG